MNVSSQLISSIFKGKLLRDTIIGSIFGSTSAGNPITTYIIGLVRGIAEDLIAVSASTGASITWNVVLIVTLVAIPFAIISELVVDHFKPFHRRK
ncbi:hypothetical protein ES703_42646 [subsurface metagenome]